MEEHVRTSREMAQEAAANFARLRRVLELCEASNKLARAHLFAHAQGYTAESHVQVRRAKAHYEALYQEVYKEDAEPSDRSVSAP